MSTATDDTVRFQLGASEFAFKAGQFVEHLLLERGLKAARDENSPVVTVHAIRSCVNEDLLEDLRKHLDERAEQESRSAA